VESLLIKIATALPLSQVTSTPDAVKTQFERTADQQEVAQLLSTGCTHMRKAFDIAESTSMSSSPRQWTIRRR
jgi:penicillin-binding protein 1A